MPTYCIPQASGVPGIYWNQPPNWLGSALPAFEPYNGWDDPRWRGALQVSWGGGAAEPEGTFRALHHTHSGQKALYLSFRASYDPDPDDAAFVLLGFADSGGTPIVGLRIVAYPADDTSVPPSLPATISNWSAHSISGTDWGAPLANPPDWVGENARHWREFSYDPGGALEHSKWQLNMRVPIIAPGGDPEDGVALPDDFRMWCAIVSDSSVGGAAASLQFALPFSQYAVLADPDDPFSADVYPNPASQWQDMRISTSTSDPACLSGDIVTLSSSDIGTTNSPASQFTYHPTNPSDPANTNTLFAAPTNETGSTLNAGDVQATFRIANWGSTIGSSADWIFVPDATPRATQGSIADGTTASASSRIEVDWTVPASMVNDFETGVRTRHQCMLVELSSGGPNLIFYPASVYRNMDFVATSSAFRRTAEISLKGLEPLKTPNVQRDVYLATEKRNMPASTDGWEPDRFNQPPRLLNPGDQAHVTGSGVAVQLQGIDPDGHRLSYAAENLPPGVKLNRQTGLISGRVTFPGGWEGGDLVRHVTASITDDGTPRKTAVVSFTWTIRAQNQPPSVVSPGARRNRNGDQVSFIIPHEDPEGGPLTFHADNLPVALSIDNDGRISGTVDTREGRYHVTVTATDDKGASSSVTFLWTITGTNQRPVLQNPGNLTNWPGEQVSFQLSANDPDNDRLTFHADGLPTGLSIDRKSGRISGTISRGIASGTVFNVTITATDDGTPPLTARIQFQWAVRQIIIDGPIGGDGPGLVRPRPIGGEAPFSEKTTLAPEIMPQYVVHVYHDTGKVTARNGVIYKILSPQPAFGYYVTHKGELSGWETQLAGAEELAPHFYKIGVPENGVKTIETIIDAKERRPGGIDEDDLREGCLTVLRQIVSFIAQLVRLIQRILDRQSKSR